MCKNTNTPLETLVLLTLLGLCILLGWALFTEHPKFVTYEDGIPLEAPK